MIEAIDALIATGDFDKEEAIDLLIKLHDVGYTVYRKKQFKNGRRPNSSQRMTPELADQIRLYFALNPTHTQQQIAFLFNVNSGRVNEVLGQPT